MKMVLGTLLCSEHPLETLLTPQRVEIVVEDHISQAAECLDYNDVSLREHARLSIGKVDIENALAILCAEHPKPQVIFAGC
jgi:ATP-dependent phosphoenolpyruvate carboxykinase